MGPPELLCYGCSRVVCRGTECLIPFTRQGFEGPAFCELCRDVELEKLRKENAELRRRCGEDY